MTSHELTMRILHVLRDLSLLPEGRAISYQGDRIKGGESKSAPPPGYGRDRREVSLAWYWEGKFASAKGQPDRLEKFLFLAERDLKRAKGLTSPVDPHEMPSARASRVIAQYEGLSSLEAAFMEDCSEMWMRATRLENDRDPDDGYSTRQPTI